MKKEHIGMQSALYFIQESEFKSCEDLLFQSKMSRKSIHFVALHTLAESILNKEIFDSLNFSILVRDSNYIPKFLQKQPGKSKYLRGRDFFEFFLENSANSKRHFLIGGSVTAQELLRKRISKSHPNFNVAGSFTGTIESESSMEFKDIVLQIQESKSDTIWVFLGSPKQDRIAEKLSRQVDASIIACGAAIDFSSGTIPDVPKLFLTMKLEWLFRVFSQPKRMLMRHSKTFLVMTKEYVSFISFRINRLVRRSSE